VSLSQSIPSDNSLTPVIHQTTDNLPQHVKGEVYWANHNTCSNCTHPCTGYYLPQERTPTHQPEAVEFNNTWFSLLINQQEQTYYTQSSLQIPWDNVLGAGYWNLMDPEHPDNLVIVCTALCTGFRFDPAVDSSSLGSSTASAHTAQSIESVHKPNSPAIETPTVTIDLVTASFGPIAINLPEQPPVKITMSVNATTTTGSAPPNRLKGVAPAVFNGDCLCSDTFWNEFCQYCLLN
jgi:hypothetical protein